MAISTRNNADAQGARLELADVNDRCQVLRQQIADVDAQLTSCSMLQGTRLLRERRDDDAELTWLESRLPSIQAAANEEIWEEQRQALNAAWAPQAERRANVARELERRVRALLEWLPMLSEAYESQKACLSEYKGMDRLFPKDNNRREGGPGSVGHQLNKLIQGRHVELAWMGRQLKPAMPEGMNMGRTKLIDENIVEFRHEVL